MENQKDHDLLIKLDVKLSEILRRLEGQDARQSDNERRIATLENFRYWILGASAAIGFLSSYIKEIFIGRH